ncbi:MAG: carboxypeptidase-like regulatory domain-containing protein [Gemmatimonadaceae bacterium]
MARILVAIVSVAVVAIAAPSALAQNTSDLRIRLETGADVPASGALVALLDAHDSVVVEGLTGELGTRVLRAPPGSYRVRVRRIGFLPFVSPAVSLPHAGELVLQVESPRVVLQSIVVNSRSQCKRNDPNAQTLSLVWDEVEKALRSSQITTQDLAGVGRAEIFHRSLSEDGVELAADTTFFTIGTRRPFAAISSEQLASQGYVIGDEHVGWSYFGPDETVLLSDQFAASHCFRLVRDPEHKGEIGVAFEPSPTHHIPDITGVLWVDEATSELREIVFSFANAGAMSRFNAGGFTHFKRLPSGAWIVDDWRLRVPTLEMRQAPYAAPHLVRTGYKEDGGRILAGEGTTGKS